MKDAFFGEVISTYTVDDGIADGLFLDAGMFDSFRVVVTTNLVETLDKYTLAAIIARSLEGVRPLISQGLSDIVKVPTGTCMVWADIIQSSKVITIMLPEDY
jgi:hypothetical protein